MRQASHFRPAEEEVAGEQRFLVLAVVEVQHCPALAAVVEEEHRQQAWVERAAEKRYGPSLEPARSGLML